MKLRPYQQETIAAIYDYLGSGKGSSCVAVVPTGGGKTAIYNSMMADMLADPDTNILMVTHKKDLIKQGAKSLLKIVPDADLSIYSAGLGSKVLSGRAVFASIQSIYKRAYDMQRIDVCFVDECHLVTESDAAMYGRFLKDLRVCNPKIKLIGLSATPFRMSTGLIYEGENAMFDGLAHEVKILDLMQDGYLARIIAKPPSVTIDLSVVGKRGGEWIESQLAAAASDDVLIKASVAEVISCAREQGRKRWLIFACNIAHAELLRAEYVANGVDARIVSSKHDDSDETLEDHARGEFPALINVDRLTTGYDDPMIDLLAVKRSTMSVGLFIQIVGRGMRPVYAPGFDLDTRTGRLAAIAAGPKPDCTLMDFGSNITTHGFIDQVEVTKKRTKGESAGDAPQKVCPTCAEYIPAGIMTCIQCGYEFPPRELNHGTNAYKGAVTSNQVESTWVYVDDVTYSKHKKADKPDSIKVSYLCGFIMVNEWLCPDHGGYAASRYTARMPALGASALTTDDALAECQDWTRPSRIKIKPNGKFHEIVQLDYKPGERIERAPAATGWRPGYDDDVIPF